MIHRPIPSPSSFDLLRKQKNYRYCAKLRIPVEYCCKDSKKTLLPVNCFNFVKTRRGEYFFIDLDSESA